MLQAAFPTVSFAIYFLVFLNMVFIIVPIRLFVFFGLDKDIPKMVTFPSFPQGTEKMVPFKWAALARG